MMYACVLRGAAVNASAMFCVEILMYNVSLIHVYMYINNACNFLFTDSSVAEQPSSTIPSRLLLVSSTVPDFDHSRRRLRGRGHCSFEEGQRVWPAWPKGSRAGQGSRSGQSSDGGEQESQRFAWFRLTRLTHEKVSAEGQGSADTITKSQKAEADTAESPKAEADAAESPKAQADAAKSPKAEADQIKPPKAEADPIKSPKAEADAAESPKAEADPIKSPKAEADPIKSPKAEADRQHRKHAGYRRGQDRC